MKKSRGLPAVLAAALCGCTSIESVSVQPDEVAASTGSAVAVIQADAIGFDALLHLIPIVNSDLDTVVNKLLVTQAKALGATKVEIKTASTTPRSGIFALTGLIIGFPSSHAEGVAVK